MKQTRTLMVAFAALLFAGVTSCRPSDEPTVEDPTLSLSVKTLTLDKQGTSQEIAVTTNQSKWNASSNVEGQWLTLEQQGTKLVVTAEPNTESTDRKGVIIVYAGNLQEKVMVTQSAADIILEVSPEEINMPYTGGSKFIAVKSNSRTWEVELGEEVDWVTLNKLGEMVEVAVKPNETGALRTIKIYAKSGTAQKEIILNQQTKVNTKYMLPYLEPQLKNDVELVKYEIARGNILLSYSPENVFFGTVFGMTSSFGYTCEAFFEVDYSYNPGGTIKQILMKSDKIDLMKSQELKDLLKNEGFKIDREKESQYFASKEITSGKTKVLLEGQVVFQENPNGKPNAGILFKTTPIQTQPYKTFDSFPYVNSEWINDPKVPFTSIKDKELAKGATVKIEQKYDPNKYPKWKDLVYLHLFQLAENEKPMVNRSYFRSGEADPQNPDQPKDLNDEQLVVWNEPTLAMWGQGRDWKITNEFKALLEKEGFEFLQESNGFPVYHNPKTKLTLLIRVASFGEDVADGAVVLAINYFYFTPQKSAYTDLDAKVEAMGARKFVPQNATIAPMAKYIRR